MKRRFKLAVCMSFVFILAVLSLVFLLAAGVIPAMIADVVLLLAAAAVLWTDQLSTKWYAKEKPPGFFQNLNWRNVPGLVLGSTKAWKYIDFTKLGGQAFNCVTYKQSFFMDFAMLKTYHSHVRKDGRVFIIYDYSETEQLGNFVAPRDWTYVHRQIFLALGMTADKEKNSHPLFYYPRLTVGFVCARILKKAGIYKKSTWKLTKDKNLDIDTSKVYKAVDALHNMLRFCWDRDLQPELILLNGNSTNNCANEIIKACFAPKYYDYDIKTVNNAKELNRYINQQIQL